VQECALHAAADQNAHIQGRTQSAGTIQSGYTLVIALREPFLRFLQDGQLLPRRLSLAADAVGLAIAGSTIYVALSDSSLTLYDISTMSRRSGIPLPAPPLALACLPHPQGSLVAVAMRNCSVVVYHGASAISRHEMDARVLGLHGGAHLSASSCGCRHDSLLPP
jgi:hypothetical protein